MLSGLSAYTHPLGSAGGGRRDGGCEGGVACQSCLRFLRNTLLETVSFGEPSRGLLPKRRALFSAWPRDVTGCVHVGLSLEAR